MKILKCFSIDLRMCKLNFIIFSFPQVILSNDDTECPICTEKLLNARRLSCNHYFHL